MPGVRDLSEPERAWLAGVIDSDGSIGLYDFGREGRRVQIQIANTDLRLVTRAREVVGCGSIANHKYPPGSRHKGKKVVYQYACKGSERGLKLLDQILPYLIVKREKAERITRELRLHPFGRWAAATPEARIRQSARMKESWQDPEIRARRTAGMNRWRQGVMRRG